MRHGQILALCAKALAHQRGAARGHAIAQREGKRGHLHHNLIRGERIGADAGNQACKDQKAQTQADRFGHGTAAHFGEAAKGHAVKAGQGKVVEAVLAQNDRDGNAGCNDDAAHRGDGRAAHAHGGEAQLAVDEDIVEKHVH